jgi:hypothetical protein
VLKDIIFKLNQKAFDSKIEELFFIVDLIAKISDEDNATYTGDEEKKNRGVESKKNAEERKKDG